VGHAECLRPILHAENLARLGSESGAILTLENEEAGTLVNRRVLAADCQHASKRFIYLDPDTQHLLQAEGAAAIKVTKSDETLEMPAPLFDIAVEH
jgi:hypothetical protein